MIVKLLACKWRTTQFAPGRFSLAVDLIIIFPANRKRTLRLLEHLLDIDCVR